MSKVAITKSKLDNLANAIAAAASTPAPLTIDQMTTAAGTLVKPVGTKQITANGTGIDVAAYAAVDVAVPSSAPTLEAVEHITPTESSQTITADTGYDALSSVQIDPISSSYVGSGVTRRSSTDLTDSGATVTAPAGYYDSAATKTVASGAVTAPSTISGTSATVSTGTNTLTLTKTVSVTPSVTTAGYISSGTAGNSSVSLTASMTTQAAQTIHPSTADQSIASGRYLTGAQTVKAVTTTNLTAANIVSGVTVKVGDSTDDDCVASVTGTASSGYSETLMKNYIARSSSFTDIEWPEGLTDIGVYAFAGCAGFNPSSLPSGITSIGSYAFYSCTAFAPASLPSGITYIYDYSFYNCTSLALTSLPSGIVGIYNYAFSRCISLTSISCNGTITTLSANAFSGNSSYPMALASVSFPNMTVSSLSYAFGSTTAANACQHLAFADIGSTRGIAANAFANCYALETLVLRRSDAICSLANVSAFLNTPLRGYNSLTGTVYVPNALISTYQTATNWSTLYNNGTITFKKIEGSDYDLS